jgi:hypothetical protein
MNATTHATATAHTDLGWRHIGWLVLFCWCCDYFDQLIGAAAHRYAAAQHTNGVGERPPIHNVESKTFGVAVDGRDGSHR